MPDTAEKLINDALQARREGRQQDATRDPVEAFAKPLPKRNSRKAIARLAALKQRSAEAR